MKFKALNGAACARSVSLAILGLGLAASADARRTAIDFDSSAIELDGQSFSSDVTHCGPTDTAPSSCRLNLSGDLSAGPIPLGFTIRIGTQDFDSFFVNEAGLITFESALDPSGDFTPVTDFAGLQSHVAQPFISAFYANLQTIDGTAPQDPFTVSSGGVLYGRGSADPVEPFNEAGLVPAVHVGWIEDINLDPFVATQVVIYYTGSTTDADATNDGDFAIRIRYGTKADDSDAYNTGVAGVPTGIGGFSFGTGTDSHDLGSPLLAAQDYYFTFHDGHAGSGGGPTTKFNLSPTDLQFGGQKRNSTSKAQRIKVKNSGTAALTLDSIIIRGANASQFTYTHDCPASLPAGAKCTVKVFFKPTSLGAKVAKLTVTPAGVKGKSVALSGKGT